MIFGYVRVSTLRQGEGESLDVQRRQIEGYALMHGLTGVEIVVEDGVSGSIPIAERPSGGPLFDMLQRGDAVIAAKLDRLFRSALDALTAVEDLKSRGVKLHLLDLGGDIAGNGLSRLFLTIAAAFAEAERDRIRERVNQSVADGRARGRYIGGKLKFGFKKVRTDGEKGAALVVDEAKRPLIEALFTMHGQGKSLRSIAGYLTERGETITHKGVQEVLARGIGQFERKKETARC